jgi:stalled ribosome rescue protein Dom34
MSSVTHRGASPEAAGTHHAVAILMDHRSARVLYLDDRVVDGGHIETDWTSPRFRTHDRHVTQGSGRDHPDPSSYFAAVAEAAERAERVVLAGPGTAKLEWLRWAARHGRHAADRVESVQSIDRATDGELTAMVRRLLHEERERFLWPRQKR